MAKCNQCGKVLWNASGTLCLGCDIKKTSLPTEGSTIYTLSEPTGLVNPDGSAQLRPIAASATLRELLMMGSQQPNRSHVITSATILLVHDAKSMLLHNAVRGTKSDA